MCAFKSECRIKFRSHCLQCSRSVCMFHAVGSQLTFEVEALFAIFALMLSVQMSIGVPY